MSRNDDIVRIRVERDDARDQWAAWKASADAAEAALRERDAEIQQLKDDDAEHLRVLQEVTGSNNTENPWLGVAASVALLQAQIKDAEAEIERLTRERDGWQANAAEFKRAYEEAHELLHRKVKPELTESRRLLEEAVRSLNDANSARDLVVRILAHLAGGE